MSEPKVFAPGCLTLAVGQDGLSLSVGAVDAKFVKSIRVEWDSETKAAKAVVEFFKSHDPDVSRQIEESIRVARTLRWVEVRY